MNILAPISNYEDVKLYSKKGVNEFFVGYTDHKWIEKFNNSGNPEGRIYLQLNNRTRTNANISLNDLQKTIEFVSTIGGRLYVTVNPNVYYTENMYSYLRCYLTELLTMGIKRVIVTDIGLIKLIHDEFDDLKMTVSCCAEVLSKSMVEFYRQFDVERIVFPRHISIDEVEAISDGFPDIEFECFALCETCVHDDGNCRGMHVFGPMCKDCIESEFTRIDGKALALAEKKELEKNRKQYRDLMVPRAGDNVKVKNLSCSLCSIGNLMKHANIKSIKLSGRGRGTEYVNEQVNITVKIINMFEEGKPIEEIRKYVRDCLGSDYCIDNNYCNMRGR